MKNNNAFLKLVREMVGMVRYFFSVARLAFSVDDDREYTRRWIDMWRRLDK